MGNSRFSTAEPLLKKNSWNWNFSPIPISRFRPRLATMKLVVIISIACLALLLMPTVDGAIANANGCIMDGMEIDNFRLGQRKLNCNELVSLYPKYACFSRPIGKLMCCHRCSEAKANGMVRCEDAKDCNPNRCGQPEALDKCPIACKRCRKRPTSP